MSTNPPRQYKLDNVQAYHNICQSRTGQISHHILASEIKSQIYILCSQSSSFCVCVANLPRYASTKYKIWFVNLWQKAIVSFAAVSVVLNLFVSFRPKLLTDLLLQTLSNSPEECLPVERNFIHWFNRMKPVTLLPAL